MGLIVCLEYMCCLRWLIVFSCKNNYIRVKLILVFMGFKEVVSIKFLELSFYDNVDYGKDGKNFFFKN